MTIEEAISHCREVAAKDCTECGKEHLQLAGWLTELKQRREDANKHMPHVVRKAKPPKKGKWLEVSMEVGEFNGDVNGKCELSIVTGKCSECERYSYNLMQYTPQMPPFCSVCGAVME